MSKTEKDHDQLNQDDLSLARNDLDQTKNESIRITRREQQKSKKKIHRRKIKRQKRNKETPFQKEKRLTRNIVTRIIVGLIFIIGGLSIFGLTYLKSAMQPLNSQAENFISVEIPLGSSNKQIAKILKKDKIIKDDRVFTLFTKLHNYGNFKSGFYNLKPSFTLEKIAVQLKKGGTKLPQIPVVGKILIKEGETIEQIAEDFEVNAASKNAERSPFTREKFTEVIKDEQFFKELQQKFPRLLTSVAQSADLRYRLEGYLYPATYDYRKKETIKEMVIKMVEKTDLILQPYYDQINDKELTVHQCLTLASLVEKEARSLKDRKMIAQVFFNRLQEDMPLQTDVSILYALGINKEKVSLDDLNVESPYNLYKNKGYGPGPFGCPSKESIESVLNPQETDDLYFLADLQTGKVYFSSTYEEHQQLMEEHNLLS